MSLQFRVQAERERLHWTQRKLAKEIGCSPSHLSQLESGDRVNISAGLFMQLAKVFNVRPEWLMWGQEPRIVGELTDQEKLLFDAWRELIPTFQEKFLGLIIETAEESKKRNLKNKFAELLSDKYVDEG